MNKGICYLIFFISSLVFSDFAFSQGCCSGGSASPIAGGISQGVLQAEQFEISSSYQHFRSNKFYVGDKNTSALLKDLRSNYIYTRFAYGITSKLTMSVEGGYFINKIETGLNPTNIDNTKESSGIADLVLFPRYSIYDRTDEKKHTEITVGMGLKIPLGKFNDSTLVYVNPTTNKRYYATSPPTIQPTNGSHDFIFYGFVYRENKKLGLRVFVNALYVKKGYNPLREKFGDYSSVGLFAGKTFFKKVGITLQLKGEWVDKTKSASGVDILALYNVDVASTGSKKISFIPQLSYTHTNLTIFSFMDIPIYQYLNGTQVGFQHLINLGASYKFFCTKNPYAIKESLK